MKFSYWLFCLTLGLMVLAGCEDGPRSADQAISDEKPVPAGFEKFVSSLPGEMIAFPPVPLIKAQVSDNILFNGGFESGSRGWQVSATQTDYTVDTTKLVVAEGTQALLITPSGTGDILVAQSVELKPRSIYIFDALVFSPGAGRFAPEMLDEAGNVLARGNIASGVDASWRRLTMTIATSLHTQPFIAGIHFTAIDSQPFPMLVDHCALYNQPVQNILPSGTMEFSMEPGKTPQWFLNGQAAIPHHEGFQSKQSIELTPRGEGRDSTLMSVLPADQLTEYQSVYASAMVKIVSDAVDPPPLVTMSLNIIGSNGTPLTATCPITGDWAEVVLVNSIPADKAQFAPKLTFTRSAGTGGKVFVDDVAVIPIDGELSGVLKAHPANPNVE